jgi:hypothetical protein
MPLDVGRLRDSDLASDETPEACWAAVLLWCASWHQVPAASVPDNDSWLAKHAGYAQRGKISKEWAEVREGALRGWIKCSDGRLYHPVVAEKAVDAWNSKLDQRWRTECGRIKKHNDRHQMSLPRPSFDEWMSLGCPSGQRLPVPSDSGDMSLGTETNVPRETNSKREREGQGQGDSISPSLRSGDSAAETQRTSSRPQREQTTLAKYLETCKANGVKPVPDNHSIREWCIDANIPVEMLQVAWVVFREKYLGDEKLKGKKYKDWPGHFANSVKDRWYGLWFTGDDGKPAWTSTGLQRKQVLEAQQSKSTPDQP